MNAPGAAVILSFSRFEFAPRAVESGHAPRQRQASAPSRRKRNQQNANLYLPMQYKQSRPWKVSSHERIPARHNELGEGPSLNSHRRTSAIWRISPVRRNNSARVQDLPNRLAIVSSKRSKNSHAKAQSRTGKLLRAFACGFFFLVPVYGWACATLRVFITQIIQRRLVFFNLWKAAHLRQKAIVFLVIVHA